MKRIAVAAVATIAIAATSAAPADAGSVYDNCTAFNAKYPHGVGTKGARDHTSGTPVTTFKRSTRLYNRAMRANSRLDGDKDHIACERA